MKLTDRSLPFIVREGLMSVIPDASAFKNSSLKKAISVSQDAFNLLDGEQYCWLYSISFS